MAETYELELGVSTNKVGSDSKETVPLINYGYSDEEWDALTSQDQSKLVGEWVEEFVWENTDNWGIVHRG